MRERREGRGRRKGGRKARGKEGEGGDRDTERNRKRGSQGDREGGGGERTVASWPPFCVVSVLICFKDEETDAERLCNQPEQVRSGDEAHIQTSRSQVPCSPLTTTLTQYKGHVATSDNCPSGSCVQAGAVTCQEELLLRRVLCAWQIRPDDL